MAKQLKFTYDEQEYTLEFTRATVREMEDSNIDLHEIDRKPMLVLELFAGAFKVHHRFVKGSVIEDIYNHMKDKKKLVAALIELYNEPIETLLDEPKEGNVEWTLNG